jgi:hypothetical protein
MIELRGRFELTDVVVLPDEADGELPHAPSPSMHPAASAATTYRLILDKSALPVLPGILPQTEVLHRGCQAGRRTGPRPEPPNDTVHLADLSGLLFEPGHSLVRALGFLDRGGGRRGRLAGRTHAQSNHGQRGHAEEGAESEDVVQTVDEDRVGMGDGRRIGEVSGAELGMTRDRVEGGDKNGQSESTTELLGDIHQP